MSDYTEPSDFPPHSSEAIRAMREEVQRVKSADPEQKTVTTNLILLLAQGHIEDVRERHKQDQKLDAILDQTTKTNGRVTGLEKIVAVQDLTQTANKAEYEKLKIVVFKNRDLINRAMWTSAGAAAVIGLIWEWIVYKVG